MVGYLDMYCHWEVFGQLNLVEEYNAQLTVIIPKLNSYVNLIGTYSPDNLALFLDKVIKGKL
jgi:hypothetical protein